MLSMDKKFIDTFQGKVHQVFFYLIDQCNLGCEQCLYKQELTFQMGHKAIPYCTVVDLMQKFFDLGAAKVTFMGGEPTLYLRLPELIHTAKKIGYEYVRIDTNGIFQEKLLDNPYMRELDEITFSLDGPNKELNDAIRGKGVFQKCVSSIQAALKRKYKVQITTCVQKALIQNDGTGDLPIMEMIEFAKSLGVNALNMHDLFKAGIPRDTFTGNLGTSVAEYMNAFKDVFTRYEAKDKDGFSIRMPQCVTSKEQFEANPEYFGYCSVKEYDRLLVFPNGMIRVCSLMIGSPYCIGYYDDERVYINETPTNEVRDHNIAEHTPCTCQNKGSHFGEHVPLCVSFKPRQEEIVWVKYHKWEERRSDESSSETG